MPLRYFITWLLVLAILLPVFPEQRAFADDAKKTVTAISLCPSWDASDDVKATTYDHNDRAFDTRFQKAGRLHQGLAKDPSQPEAIRNIYQYQTDFETYIKKTSRDFCAAYLKAAVTSNQVGVLQQDIPAGPTAANPTLDQCVSYGKAQDVNQTAENAYTEASKNLKTVLVDLKQKFADGVKWDKNLITYETTTAGLQEETLTSPPRIDSSHSKIQIAPSETTSPSPTPVANPAAPTIVAGKNLFSTGSNARSLQDESEHEIWGPKFNDVNSPQFTSESGFSGPAFFGFAIGTFEAAESWIYDTKKAREKPLNDLLAEQTKCKTLFKSALPASYGSASAASPAPGAPVQSRVSSGALNADSSACQPSLNGATIDSTCNLTVQPRQYQPDATAAPEATKAKDGPASTQLPPGGVVKPATPDGNLNDTDTASGFFEEHKTAIIVGGVGVAAVGGIIAYKLYEDKQQQKEAEAEEAQLALMRSNSSGSSSTVTVNANGDSFVGGTPAGSQAPAGSTLVVEGVPSSATSGSAMGTITVNVVGVNGVMTQDSSVQVTASCSSPSTCTLSGTTTVVSLQGKATFSNLIVGSKVSGAQLQFSAPGFTAVKVGSITVN